MQLHSNSTLVGLHRTAMYMSVVQRALRNKKNYAAYISINNCKLEAAFFRWNIIAKKFSFAKPSVQNRMKMGIWKKLRHAKCLLKFDNHYLIKLFQLNPYISNQLISRFNS